MGVETSAAVALLLLCRRRTLKGPPLTAWPRRRVLINSTCRSLPISTTENSGDTWKISFFSFFFSFPPIPCVKSIQLVEGICRRCLSEWVGGGLSE